MPWLQREFDLSPSTAGVVAQIGCPAAAQILGTPCHLLGLDFYNRPTVPLATRIADAFKNSMQPLLARMVREADICVHVVVQDLRVITFSGRS